MLIPNTILQDRYRIERLLGKGGMGAVYLAEDQRFGSKVALKESFFTRPNLRKAFEREAGLLHRLRHPALPVVMDYFTEGHGQYLIMQFIPGSDLEELLVERFEKNQGPFPTDQVLQWTDRLLDALEYLHGHKPPIVHRDIKPQNLKLTPRGEVILLDFGLAKGAATEMSQAGASLHGYSLHYAPLEQMSGKGTDSRSDLYSLAATMHRLVTGEIPPDAMARRAAFASGQPDLIRPANELNRQVPAAVAAVLSRALALYPNGRPATAAEMRRALSEASWPVSTYMGETGPRPPLVTQIPDVTPDDELTAGLRGEYFDNEDFTNPKLIRTDETIDFNWGFGAPHRLLSGDYFSIRWTGQIVAPSTGKYTFVTRSDDGVRLWLENRLLIDNFTPHPETEDRSVPVKLDSGQSYNIRLEYFELTANALIRLMWIRPGQTNPEIIPSSALSPPSNANPAPVLTSISPARVPANSSAFTLMVQGNDFQPDAVAQWNCAARPTTFVSDTEITASIPASDLQSAGIVNITAVNPLPGGGTSNPLRLTVSGGYEADVAPRPNGGS